MGISAFNAALVYIVDTFPYQKISPIFIDQMLVVCNSANHNCVDNRVLMSQSIP